MWVLVILGLFEFFLKVLLVEGARSPSASITRAINKTHLVVNFQFIILKLITVIIDVLYMF